MLTAGVDGDLARRLQQGDTAAHAELCRRFGPTLHEFAASRLAGDEELAEDVVVVALVDAVRNIRRYDPRKATLSAWLHGIARHRVQKVQRSQRRGRSVPQVAQVSLERIPELPAGDDVAIGVTERLATRGMLARLASALSQVEMEVLLLRCLGEFSMKEIARMVRRSERAVQTLLHRAKHKARKSLENHAE
jgi:RNA polymerase sigma-70 factor (ECF subfamily)